MSKKSQNTSGTDISVLLDIAKGVIDPTAVGIKESQWVYDGKNTRELIRFRRSVRRGIILINHLMKLEKPLDERHQELKEIIEKQLNPNLGLTWKTFSFKWDIHPKEPLTVILKEHWVKEGGGFDSDLGYHYPHAFTNDGEIK